MHRTHKCRPLAPVVSQLAGCRPNFVSVVLTVPADAEAASWHLDSVEVQVGDGGGGSSSFAAPTFFACHRWLDVRSGYRAELAPSARNPRQEEVEYKVG